MSVFNANNSEWKTGKYKLFFGEAPGLYDSINKQYPELFELYHQQKSQDWREDEVDLSQDRLDFLSCNKSNYDIMVKTLAFQWELDSVASRAIAPLFSPFASGNEGWAWLSKVSEIEVLHALTYSEIVRQAVPNPQEALKEALENQNILKRATKVVEIFDNLAKVGAKVTLGLIERDCDEAKDAVILGMVALFALERIEFMSSFACTFALAELGIFQGIAKLVGKILADEQLHYNGDKLILKILMNEEPEAFSRNKGKMLEILQDVREAEYSWNEYIFSEGRSLVGLNRPLLNDWVDYNVQDCYNILKLEIPFSPITENPLPFMETWMDLDTIQVAPQESTTVNYQLNSVVDDLGDEELEL